MKHIKLLLLLALCCTLQFSWAQDAPLNNGRKQSAKPAPVAEKADSPTTTDTFNGSDFDVPRTLDNATEDMVFPADLAILQEEIYASSSPQKVVEKLNALSAQVEALMVANEELRRENEVIRKSLNSCCTDANLQAEDAYLLQNAPNPVVDNSTIRYYVPENMTDARVEITDLKGIVVQTYEIQEMGMNTMRVDTQNLGTGNYVYTLFVEGNIVDSRIMVVTK